MEHVTFSQKYIRFRDFHLPVGWKDPVLIYNIFAENLDEDVVINEVRSK